MNKGKSNKGNQKEKKYEPPKIVTYTEDEITEIIGPANTCGSPCLGGHQPFPPHSGHHGHHHHR